ncbi:PAS domain S-box protein [Hydrogenimonas thermophila]|uniref:histidine kinase n=1 Tax=Hydrogenimonas thermophila TaxID=223786 RepID=A0A1I5SB94_9BACT|nr:PAS domain S-box protein [Hydrogenimonas thermophila]SFP68048.1 PAS domain S-box-containing protein [Hydrogenimonas thermophila]
MKINIKDKLRNIFFKTIIIPFIILSLFLATIFILLRNYMFTKVKSLEIEKTEKILNIVIDNEKNIIDYKFANIELLAKLLQKEHEKIFKDRYISDKDVSFKTADNGVFYKTTQKGSSLYYSASTKISKHEKSKALFTENMDTLFKALVDNNKLITSVYFNSYDNMNRIYPFINKIYKQYGPTLIMQNYNFYYLADQKHNPQKKPVWTEAYLDPAGRGWMISCIVPIYNKNFLEGVTGIDITIEEIIDNLLNKKLPFDSKLILISKNGTITAMPKEIEQLTNIQELTTYNYTEIIKNTIKKPKIFNIYKSRNRLFQDISEMIKKKNKIKEVYINNKSYILILDKIKTTNSYLLLITKKSKLLETVNTIQNNSKIIIFILTLISLFLFFIIYKLATKRFSKLSNEITEPIIYLSNISSNFDQNKDNLSYIGTGISEIDTLNQNFINMIKEIKIKNDKLKGFNMELSEKIKSATSELIEKNLKLSEAIENFQNILDMTIEMIVFTKDGKIVDVNKSGVKMVGYSKKSEVIGRDLSDFIPQEELPKIIKAFKSEITPPYETTLINKDGKYLYVLASGKYISLNGQKIRMSTAIDLTEVKRKDELLFQQSKQAQMGEMVKMIAHHWRQPLNAISAASIELTIKKELGELKDDEFIQVNEFIQQQCQEMSKTINTFIQFSQSKSEIKKFNILDVINHVIAIVEIEFKNFNIEIIIENKNIVLLTGYSDMFEQVILNILINARDAYNDNKSAKDKKIYISIDNNQTVSIKDYAGGIKSENIDKLFTPYFTTKEQGKPK